MAYLNKAIIYGNTGDYENAMKYCDKIIELYPHLKDMAITLKHNFTEQRIKNSDNDSSEINSKAKELIDKANALKDEDETWENDLISEIQPDMPKFRKVTEWDAWELYEDAIEIDPKCETLATSGINEIKAKLLSKFLFFNITMNDDFNPERKLDSLKIIIISGNHCFSSECKCLVEICIEHIDSIS